MTPIDEAEIRCLDLGQFIHPIGDPAVNAIRQRAEAKGGFISTETPMGPGVEPLFVSVYLPMPHTKADEWAIARPDL